MGIKTTYSCDKCNKEQERSMDLWKIGFTLQNASQIGITLAQHDHQLWCLDCINEIDLLGKKLMQYNRELAAKNEVLPPKPPTLEEKLLTVLAEFVKDVQEN